MASSKTKDSGEAAAGKERPAITAEKRSALSDKALAEAVLERRLRPRVSEMRRLAEAVLAAGKKAKKRKADKPADDADQKVSGKKAAKAKGGRAKKRKKDKGRGKLATIPAPARAT